MGLTKLSVQNVGHKTGQGIISGHINWTNVVDQFPISNNLSPWGPADVLLTSKFKVDPASIQSSFVFGTAKALQLAISWDKSQLLEVLSSAPGISLGGRVLVYVPSSQQAFYFAPPAFTPASTSAGYPSPYSTLNVCVPIVAGQPSEIDFYLEQITFYPDLSSPPAVDVQFNIFNFDVKPFAIASM